MIFLPSGPVRQKEPMAVPFSVLMRAWVMARPSWPMVLKTWEEEADAVDGLDFDAAAKPSS